MKRDLVGGEWRMRVRDRGEWRQLVETVVKTGLVMKKGENKSSTSISASLTRTTGKKGRATTIPSLRTRVSFCYTKHMAWRLSTCHICNMQALCFMWVSACARLQQIK